MTFFTEIEKFHPRIHIETKRPQISKEILSKNSNAGGTTIPIFKLYYRPITKQHGIGTKTDMKTKGFEQKPQT
jgi:hypothetical protein